MAITKQIAKMILSEHVREPIKGRVLMGGRQTMIPTVEEIREYLREFGLEERPTEFEVDEDTLASHGESYSDRNFFSLFTDAEYNALDVTDYEGAEIIHDMNYPVPDEFKGQFSFIYDGGAMDNLFNPAQYILNCSEMLAPGGRILHCEMGSLWRGAYVMYSADYFHDFYAINRYENCHVYYARFYWSMLLDRWRISHIKPFKDAALQKNRRNWVSSMWPHLVLVLAEKGEESTSDRMPIQHTYRPEDEDFEIYMESYRRFASNPRRPATFGKPTHQPFEFKKRMKAIFKRPVPLTRSNTTPIQKL